ncbi:hypothetical protein AB0B10_26235 [Micromonospora arborensis]|uniref:hypothetical protein n=1 Tax=Micromonospora arborensis TaxID=2116518 RepID=UPI0033D0EBA9
MIELKEWLAGELDVRRFPYEKVLAAFHQCGKHFVGKDLLNALDEARARRAELRGPAPAVHHLITILDIALDKADGRYDYQSYLALNLLPMPSIDDDVAPETACGQRDRLVVSLLADALRFELAAQRGETDLLPQQRPDPGLVAKRLRLGVRAALPAQRRAGLAESPGEAAAAQHLCATVDAALSAHERNVLASTMFPVYTVHDEYLFIRVLQCWETTFAQLAVTLAAATVAIGGGHGRTGAHHLRQAAGTLRESAPLFSLLATMQVQSFRSFRSWTEGASAIQSRTYKLVESLCRAPEQSRLDSLAYVSVPDVRDQVLAGRATIEQSYRMAAAAGLFATTERGLVEQAMRDFAQALAQWRQTHYRLAMRMLGGRSGTGYTEGTPYLDAVRKTPVFELPPGAGDRNCHSDRQPSTAAPARQSAGT